MAEYPLDGRGKIAHRMHQKGTLARIFPVGAAEVKLLLNLLGIWTYQ
jgi:hypothetical protein